MALQKEPTELPAAYRAFQAAFPEIWQAYDRLGTVRAHTRLALQAGTSPEEIRPVMLLALTTIGFPSMMAARTWVEDALARTGRGW